MHGNLTHESYVNRHPITIDRIDKRTKAGRKLRLVLRTLQRELGRMPTNAERLAMERVACLCAMAEDARSRVLTGKGSVSIDMAVRADGAYRRALADFRVIARQPKPELGATPGMAALFGSDEAANG